jgi:hypothetical protein
MASLTSVQQFDFLCRQPLLRTSRRMPNYQRHAAAADVETAGMTQQFSCRTR